MRTRRSGRETLATQPRWNGAPGAALILASCATPGAGKENVGAPRALSHCDPHRCLAAVPAGIRPPARRGPLPATLMLHELGIAAAFRGPMLEWRGPASACAWPGLEENPSHGANLHVDEAIACSWPRACGCEPRPGRGQRCCAAVADPSGCRSRRGTDPERAVGLGIRPLPRLAAGVCGAMGLAYAGLLPLPGAAWLLTGAKSNRTSRDAYAWSFAASCSEGSNPSSP